MDPILEEDLKKRRIKLMAQCQQYMAQVHGESINAVTTPAQVGQIAGRSVKQINSIDSKETRLYQNRATSTKDGRIVEGRVNNIKKTEKYSSNKIQINLNALMKTFS